ncbi:MAG TPA: DinB family protein [Bryobacteraceae bacterium]|nr:DinB family protein [Bryobacteraceae bacterium]
MEEPWLRGPIPGLDPSIAPILYAFAQAREDLAHYTDGLTPEQIWSRPYDLASVGFHMRHIAGSIDRLMIYLTGAQLSESQLASLAAESVPGASREELLAELDAACTRAESIVRALDPAILPTPREVGRKRLPTTVIGLLTHIAEHTQRHVGQAITTAKLVREYWNR